MNGRIQISRSTYERVHDLYTFEERMVQVKGKGECTTYLIQSTHHENPIVEFNFEEDEIEAETLEQQQQPPEEQLLTPSAEEESSMNSK